MMEILKKLFNGKGYIDGITIINLQGEILFSAKLNDKLSPCNSEKQLVGKNFYDVYENLSPTNSTTYRAMQVGLPAYVENQYLKVRGQKGIRITSLSIPIKSGNRIVGAIDLSTEEQPKSELSNALHITMGTDDLYQNCTDRLKNQNKAYFTKEQIIAEDDTMIAACDYIDVVASCSLPVMIYGETGTGKEVFAQAIHNASSRKDHPFVAQNCAAIPETLLESIIFGTSKGAFTGAMENTGLLELADGGTLFLDEINSMPVTLQSKLLRVLQDGHFCKLGSHKDISVDVRFITALNTPPLDAIKKGQLRKDIYYRLSMMSISIPPIRERPKDIPAFAKMYVQKHNFTFHKQIEFISNELIEKLQKYSWPGNVRELEQVIVYGMSSVSSSSHVLEYHDIEAKFERLLQQQCQSDTRQTNAETLREAVAEYERSMIADTLGLTSGNLSKAAKILDIPRQTLQRKVKQYNIDSCFLLD